jgi:hypothetical protein
MREIRVSRGSYWWTCRRDKTLIKMLDADVWHIDMNLDVRQFVKSCVACQRVRTDFKNAA